jgi:hypothetical protein
VFSGDANAILIAGKRVIRFIYNLPWPYSIIKYVFHDQKAADNRLLLFLHNIFVVTEKQGCID